MTMPTKTTKTSPNGAKKKLTDDELPEERITLRTVLDAVVNIHSRLNRIEFEVKAIAAKAAAEARELAMPLEFGTRVKVKGREEENWRIACDEPTDDGYWRLAPPKCGNLNTMTAKRSEFTIIP